MEFAYRHADGALFRDGQQWGTLTFDGNLGGLLLVGNRRLDWQVAGPFGSGYRILLTEGGRGIETLDFDWRDGAAIHPSDDRHLVFHEGVLQRLDGTPLGRGWLGPEEARVRIDGPVDPAEPDWAAVLCLLNLQWSARALLFEHAGTVPPGPESTAEMGTLASGWRRAGDPDPESIRFERWASPLIRAAGMLFIGLAALFACIGFSQLGRDPRFACFAFSGMLVPAAVGAVALFARESLVLDRARCELKRSWSLGRLTRTSTFSWTAVSRLRLRREPVRAGRATYEAFVLRIEASETQSHRLFPIADLEDARAWGRSIARFLRLPLMDESSP